MTKAPEWLAGRALGKWNELIGQVSRRPGLRQSAYDLLAAYCAAYGRWMDAEDWLANPEHGVVLTIRDDKGNVKSHGPAPQATIAERAAKEMGRIAKELRL